MLNRFVGNLSQLHDKSIRLDGTELCLRLLLTDTVILDTHRLIEVNDLIRLFGIDGLMQLFDSGKLRLTCEAFAFGFRHDLVQHEDEFLLQNVWGQPGQREWYLGTSFQNVRVGGGVVQLSRSINKFIEEPPGPASSDACRQYLHHRMMSDTELLREAIVLAGKTTGLAPALEFSSLRADVEQCVSGVLHYRVNTNLPPHLSVEARRQILSSAISAIANIGVRLDEMRRHNALTEGKESDLPLLERSMRFFETGARNAQPVEQFRRLLTIRGMAGPSNTRRVKARRLIDAAGSAECLELRQWLQTKASTESDEEIQRRFGSWHAKVRSFMSSGVGAAIMWLVMKATKASLGDAGVAVGPLDGLLRKLLNPGGPVLFINRTYPSLFERPAYAAEASTTNASAGTPK